jgi:hypothetical protein
MPGDQRLQQQPLTHTLGHGVRHEGQRRDELCVSSSVLLVSQVGGGDVREGLWRHAGAVYTHSRLAPRRVPAIPCVPSQARKSVRGFESDDALYESSDTFSGDSLARLRFQR